MQITSTKLISSVFKELLQINLKKKDCNTTEKFLRDMQRIHVEEETLIAN